MKQPSEIMRDAIKLIRERGWNQGDYEGPCGGLCPIGAINEASGYWPDGQGITRGKRLSASQGYICRSKLRELIGGTIHLWNDSPERTRTEVLRKMGQAARNLEKEGS